MPQQRHTPSRSRHPLNDDLFVRGAIICAIGLVMVLAPHWMRASALSDLFAQVQAVAWFAVVLGSAFMLQFWRNYRRKQAAQALAEQTIASAQNKRSK